MDLSKDSKGSISVLSNDDIKNASLWSFDDASDEEEYMDANTLNKSMILTEDDNSTKANQSEVSTLQQLSKDTLKDMGPQDGNNCKEVTLILPAPTTSNDKHSGEEEEKLAVSHQIQKPLANDSTPAIDIDQKEVELGHSETVLKDVQAQSIIAYMPEDIVETVMDLMKKRDGVLTFGTVENMYSFRNIQCLFKINSIEDEGTIGIYRLCRFDSSIVADTISQAVIIDSHRRKLVFCCPKELIDEQEYYQFCFKNKSQHIVVASLPFKIMVDEFGSRSVLGEVQLAKLGCISQEDDALIHCASNPNPEEDDEGEFVIVRSKKILLEEKIRELTAHINVLEHDRAVKNELIEQLGIQLDLHKEFTKQIKTKCEADTECLTNALAESDKQLAAKKKEVTSLKEENVAMKLKHLDSHNQRAAKDAARDAYINSLKYSVSDLQRQVKSLENLSMGLTDKCHMEKIANERREADMRRATEDGQKKFADLIALWNELNIKHEQLNQDKTRLEEIVAQKCKTFAEQEEQSSINVRQLKARLAQAAEEYEELFRKNYRLEKKYNQLLSNRTVQDRTVNVADGASKDLNQTMSILAEVTGKISKETDKNNVSESSDAITDDLIRRIKFQQQKPVPIPRSSYSFDVPNISSMINALLTSPLNFSDKCSQCKKETTNGTLCSTCHSKEMLSSEFGFSRDALEMKTTQVDSVSTKESKQEEPKEESKIVKLINSITGTSASDLINLQSLHQTVPH